MPLKKPQIISDKHLLELTRHCLRHLLMLSGLLLVLRKKHGYRNGTLFDALQTVVDELSQLEDRLTDED